MHKFHLRTRNSETHQRSGCEPLRDKPAKNAEAKLKALGIYWKEQFDTAGEPDRWKDYLFRYADRSKESPEQVREGF
jgi:hypothetical protein